MELVNIILAGGIIGILLILLDLRFGKINNLKKEILKEKASISSLTSTNHMLSQENKSVVEASDNIINSRDNIINSRDKYLDGFVKKELIQKIVILIVKQIENNVLKQLTTSISNNIEKSKSFNMIVLPQATGIEIKALSVVKDKNIPNIFIYIKNIVQGIEVVDYISLSDFIDKLSTLSYSTLEILHRRIEKNIENLNNSK